MSAAASHVISWFEIPSTDFERAVRFYETVLGTELRRENVGDQPIGIFQYTEPATGGSVIHSPTAKPSADGVVVYLNAQPNVDVVLDRVEKAGAVVGSERADIDLASIA